MKPCIDKEKIGRILNHSEVINWLTDDNCKGDYVPVIHPSIIYLVDDMEKLVIRIDPMNSVTCSVHIASLPEMWGKGSDVCKEAIKWGFTNTLYQKVVAIIPVFNKRCIGLVKKLGFEQEGVLKKSFLKDWQLQDQIVFGFCKGESKWHL